MVGIAVLMVVPSLDESADNATDVFAASNTFGLVWPSVSGDGGVDGGERLALITILVMFAGASVLGGYLLWRHRQAEAAIGDQDALLGGLRE